MKRYIQLTLVVLCALLPLCSIAQNVGRGNQEFIDIDVEATYISIEFATLIVKTTLPKELIGKELKIVAEIKNNVGNIVAYQDMQLIDNQQNEILQNISIENPWLWSENNTYFYVVERRIYDDEEIIDNSKIYIALKDFYYVENRGFVLNGENYNLRAVRYRGSQVSCLDDTIALIRNMMLLREMGCNTILVDEELYPKIERICNVIGVIAVNSATIDKSLNLFDGIADLNDVIDNAFIPKDKYYYYQSIWRKDLEQLHLLPHWNWIGREGEITPILAYTNYPKIELFVNENSAGISESCRNLWYDVEYSPGEVKAVAYDADNKVIKTESLKTPSKANKIDVEVHQKIQLPRGRGFATFVTVSVTDEYGTLVNDYNKKISVKIKGDGELLCMLNGSKSDNCTDKSSIKAHNGKVTIVIHSQDEDAQTTLLIKGKGVKKETEIF